MPKHQTKSSWLEQGEQDQEWSAEEWARWEREEQSKWQQVAEEIRNNYNAPAAAAPETPSAASGADPKDWPAPVGLQFFQPQQYMSKFCVIVGGDTVLAKMEDPFARELERLREAGLDQEEDGANAAASAARDATPVPRT